MNRSPSGEKPWSPPAGPPTGSPEAPPGPFLLVQRTETGRTAFPLDRELTRVGRRTDNDIHLLESHISKRHAEILRKGGQFRILDVGSKAGVFVNGVRVRERDLAEGDIITFGPSPVPNVVFHQAGSSALSSRSNLLTALRTTTGEQSLEKLARFLEFNRILGSRFTLNEILENVVDLAADLTGAERGFLILRGPDGSLDYRVARGRDKAPIPREEIRVSETIVREVLGNCATRVVSDVLEEEGLVGQESVLSLNLRSAVALPLWHFSVPEREGSPAEPSEEVFGVLYLDSRQTRGRFTRIDRGILESLARNASSIIENARLFRESEEKHRMEEELERAREVQAALLPQGFWKESFFEVSGSCVPCLQLGGDYLDQFRLPGNRCCLVMADVAGKGMSAALLAAALQGMMAAETATPQPLGGMVRRINRAIYRLSPRGKFVTFFCSVLSPDGDLTYVNAGHTPPMVLTESGDVRMLATGDMAMGLRESTSYQEGSVKLRPGETLVLYTDGVTEAINGAGQIFGESRLEETLRASPNRSAEEILELVLERVKAFSGGLPARDDVTLMVLKYLGREAGK